MNMKKSVVITGAAGGIGEALCQAFTGAGYHVIATDLREPKGNTAAFVEVDLLRLCTDAPYRDHALARLRAHCAEGLACLINNAALQVVRPIEALSADDWERSLRVNTLAPFLLTQGLLPQLEKAAGSVVNVASIHNRLTKPEFTAYATSKAALVGLTRAMAVELGPRVRVNAISPAAVATPMLKAGFAGRDAAFAELGAMHPVGRIGEPREIAELALFLASDAARFLTGAELAIDGAIGARLHDPA